MSEVRGSGQEGLPHDQGQGRQLKGAMPRPRSRAAAESARLQQCRSSQLELPLPEASGGDREEWPHIHGAVAMRAPEGSQELFHV